MEENQTNQNSTQNPSQQEHEQVVQQAQQEQQQVVQQVQQEQPQQVQQNVSASVSMQIQELLVKQQQYQQQYNQLVEYVKNTPNLPIEQVNQVKQQLDQLNALFVEGKQKLQALGYTQVQVNKPVEVKKGSKINLSFKKLAVGCLIILVLLLTGLFLALFSLIKNPNALLGFGFRASTAKSLLMVFFGLLLGSLIILMIGVVVSNIYRLITVKNQSKGRFVGGLIGGIFGIGILGALLGVVFSLIGRIVTDEKPIEYDIIQPYLVGRVITLGEDEFKYPYDNSTISGIGKEYNLIAPSEIAFSLRWDEFTKLRNEKLPSSIEIEMITLSCGNGEDKELKLTTNQTNEGRYKFDGTCLYSKAGQYKYSIGVTYNNTLSNERKIATFEMRSLDFKSEIIIYKTSTTSSSSNSKMSRLLGSNGEFILGQAPAKITVDSTEVFRNFSLGTYEVEWDMDGDFENDRMDQEKFDYSYKIPQVYYVTYKFPGLADVWYRFPVRVEQSDKPVCGINVIPFPGTTKYQISTYFVDESSAATISSYNYTIKDKSTGKDIKEFRNGSQEFNREFPEKGNYVVVLDYVTVDGKQGRCESDLIQLEKETFKVDYALLSNDSESGKFKEVCNSKGREYSGCTQISLDTVPQKYRLQIRSITPSSNTMKKVVYLDDVSLLNEEDAYSFDIPDEGTYILKIVTSDVSRGMQEEAIEIKFTAKKPDIIGNMTVISNETRLPVSEGFEPLTVILDASKTEINVPGDEIIYFTWDFGDGEIKRNQQNGIVAHTYNFDYARENGIFQPKVTITTKEGLTDVILGPKINVKKGLINVELQSLSHPSRQAGVGKDVTFSAEFDGLPEKMIWDFGDGTPTYTCQGRTCTEVVHAYKEAGLYSVKLSLEFDAVQQVDGTMDFKVY